MVSIIILASLFISTDVVLNTHEQTKSSSASAIIKPSSSLNQRQLALAEKQPIPTMFDSKLLDVPLINQMSAPQLYNGCEVTSLAMILNYSGYSVTKNELAEKIKTVPFKYGNGLYGNPNAGFVGDIDDGPGYAVYNGPVYNLAKQYAGDQVVNLTGSPFIELLKKVSAGEPVWVITTTSFGPVSDFKRWQTPQGAVNITFSEHSVVITGYDSNYIYINDPYGVKNRKVNRNYFEKAWIQMGSQAIFIKI